MKQAEARAGGARAGRRRHCRIDKERDEGAGEHGRAGKRGWRCCARWWPNVTACCQEVREAARGGAAAARAGDPPDRHRRTHGSRLRDTEGGAEGSPGGRPPASDRTAGSGPPGQEGGRNETGKVVRIKAFRRALELGGGERADGCRHFPRWKTELRNFCTAAADLASNTLAYHSRNERDAIRASFLWKGTLAFSEAENSTVHGHVIVLLDGEYIDLTLDQFDEYPDYIPYEPVESDGQIGKLLRNIMKHEGPSKTRQIDLDGGEELYARLRDTADEVLATDPEWQAGNGR